MSFPREHCSSTLECKLTVYPQLCFSVPPGSPLFAFMVLLFCLYMAGCLGDSRAEEEAGAGSRGTAESPVCGEAAGVEQRTQASEARLSGFSFYLCFDSSK